MFMVMSLTMTRSVLNGLDEIDNGKNKGSNQLNFLKCLRYNIWGKGRNRVSVAILTCFVKKYLKLLQVTFLF